MSLNLSAIEEASPKKVEKTALVADIERRLNEKRMEKESKKRKEKERDTKYTPKTVIVVHTELLNSLRN